MNEKIENKNYDSESRNYYELLFQLATDVLLVLDESLNILDVNQAVQGMFGYEPRELTGRNLSELRAKTDPDLVQKRVQELQEVGTLEFLGSYLHKNGTEIAVEVHAKRTTINHQTVIFSIVRDVTDRKKQERELLSKEKKYRAVIETSHDGFWITDAKGRILEVNDAYCKASGYNRDELLGMKIPDLEAIENPEETKKHIEKIFAEGHDRFESYHRKKNGSIWPVEIIVSYWPIDEGVLFVFIVDITTRKRQFEELHLMAMVFQNAGEAMLITNETNHIVNVNPSFTRLTGYTLNEVFGKNPSVLSSGKESKEYYREMWEQLKRTGMWQGEIHDRRKDGSIYPKWLTINTVTDEVGNIKYYVASFMDITNQKRAEDEIRKLAYTDTLTGLQNRMSLINRLEQEIESAKRNQTRISVMFIDLDRFKNINDTLGHRIGDALIVEVAKTIQENLRRSDQVARLGGDEFMVILAEQTRSEDTARIAHKLIQAVSEPYEIEGHNLYSSPSIGISSFPEDGTDVATLMQNADTAMYQAKRNGGKTFVFFDTDMNRKARERLDFENGLRHALETSEFELYYQVQVGKEFQVQSLEALIRWNHPEWGLVPPDRFIPIAEETGIIVGIGLWVLEKACSQFQEWIRKGYSISHIAVNLSAYEILQDDFLAVIDRVIQHNQMRPGQLELEITENVAMINQEKINRIMQSLKEKGVLLSIDDFGTGYSSLAYLGRFPIDSIKLDRSFIKEMDVSETALAIITSTIDLARKLKMNVVAEGVETETQARALFQYGCDLQQGYYYSKPLPALEVEKILEGNYLW